MRVLQGAGAGAEWRGTEARGGGYDMIDLRAVGEKEAFGREGRGKGKGPDRRLARLAYRGFSSALNPASPVALRGTDTAVYGAMPAFTHTPPVAS